MQIGAQHTNTSLSAARAAWCCALVPDVLARMQARASFDSCAIMTQHLVQGCSVSSTSQQYYYRYL